jgi:pimeloyl-ACP methyl ester carboxylesterase
MNTRRPRALHHRSRRITPRRARAGATWKLAGALAIAVVAQELAARAYFRRTPPPEERFVTDERTAWTPAWREWLFPVELARGLLRTPRSDSVVRGDGAPVILVPGFLMSGAYLGPMRRWLQSIGYDARVADIGVNADCFEATTNRILHDVDTARRRAGRRVHLVGHSLGGALAKAAAGRRPDAIASIVLLGAPVRGLRLHPALRVAAAIVRARIHRDRVVPATCATFACSCETVRALAAEPPRDLPVLTIATEDDGVADWRYSIDPLATRAFAVRGSHLGLVVNPAVYEALAQHLAGARARAAA